MEQNLYIPNTLEGLANSIVVLDGIEDPLGYITHKDWHFDCLRAPLPKWQHSVRPPPTTRIVADESILRAKQISRSEDDGLRELFANRHLPVMLGTEKLGAVLQVD